MLDRRWSVAADRYSNLLPAGVTIARVTGRHTTWCSRVLLSVLGVGNKLSVPCPDLGTSGYVKVYRGPRSRFRISKSGVHQWQIVGVNHEAGGTDNSTNATVDTDDLGDK